MGTVFGLSFIGLIAFAAGSFLCYCEGRKNAAVLCIIAAAFCALFATSAACYKQTFRVQLQGVYFEGVMSIWRAQGIAYNANNYTVTLSSGVYAFGSVYKRWIITLQPKESTNFNLCATDHLQIAKNGKVLVRMTVKELCRRRLSGGE